MQTYTEVVYLVEFDAYDGPVRDIVSAGLVDDGDRVLSALPAYKGYVMDKHDDAESMEYSRALIDQLV